MAVLYDHVIASFDTEIKPTGKVNWEIHHPKGPLGIPLPPRPIPHPGMTKLHHELHLVINGPDGSDVSKCVQSVVTGPLLAALIVAYDVTKGGLKAAEDAVLTPLQACLGQGFAANFNDYATLQIWDA
jgi:hypothetical protein